MCKVINLIWTKTENISFSIMLPTIHALIISPTTAIHSQFTTSRVIMKSFNFFALKVETTFEISISMLQWNTVNSLHFD